MSFPPLAQLLPHRPPMLWLDEVVAQQDDSVHCRLTIRAEHVFVQDSQVEPVLAIEWMAQTVAALMGLRDRVQEDEPRPGYLIAIPEAHFLVDVFRLGDVVDVHAHKSWGDEALASFDARVERAGELAVSAQLSVYRRTLSTAPTGSPS